MWEEGDGGEWEEGVEGVAGGGQGKGEWEEGTGEWEEGERGVGGAGSLGWDWQEETTREAGATTG